MKSKKLKDLPNLVVTLYRAAARGLSLFAAVRPRAAVRGPLATACPYKMHFDHVCECMYAWRGVFESGCEIERIVCMFVSGCEIERRVKLRGVCEIEWSVYV